MRQIIFILTVSLFMISCGQTDTKQKELELKEREIAIKEKELALAYNDSIKSSSIKPSIQIPVKINKMELPFTGEKHFNFFGGNSSGYTLSISKDGIVKIKREVSPGYQDMLGVADNDLIVFKGPFKTIIKTKDGYRYKIEADKISMLDSKGNIEKGCGNLGDEICSTAF